MKTICFYNHKGGVGKTTLTAAVAGEMISEGKKVLIVDTDSQGNLSNQFNDNILKELADYLFEDSTTLQDVISRTRYDGLYLIPTKKLSNGGRLDKWARTEATEAENRNRIKNMVGELKSLGLDYVLFDMPPSYTELDKQVLLSSDEVVPVLDIDKYSIDGLSDFFKLLEKLKSGEKKPVLKGIVFNHYQKNKAVQKGLMPIIEKMDMQTYLLPSDEIFKKAAMQSRAVQALNGMKKDTQIVLSKITKDLEAE